MNVATRPGWDRSGEEVLREYRLPAGLPPDLCGPFRATSIVWWPRLGAGAVRPVPEARELDHFYGHQYRRVMSKMRGLDNYLRSPNYVAQARSQLGWVPAPASGHGRWLDIGAGFGLLLHEARRRFPGWDFWAVEADADALLELEGRGHTVIPPGRFWDQQHPVTQVFDVVTLSHVLEHLPDPWTALRRIASWLRPEGWLMVEVPNDPRPALLHPERHSDLPHLWFFAKDGLQRVVEAAGYEVTRAAEVGLWPHVGDMPRATRLRLAIKRRMRGTMSLLHDTAWYAEGPGRANVRVLGRIGR